MFIHVIIIIAGFFLGIFIKPKPATRLCIYISIGSAFAYGFWAIAIFFELIFGMFLAAYFIGKMQKLEETDPISLPWETPQQEIKPLSIEENTIEKNNEQDKDNLYQNYIIENFDYENFTVYNTPVQKLSNKQKYLELLNYILFIEILRNVPDAKKRITEIPYCFDLLSRISQLSDLSFDELLSSENNTLKDYIETLSKQSKYKHIIKNTINKDYNNFVENISFRLFYFLYNKETATIFIDDELKIISEESKKGKKFFQDSFGDNFIYHIDKKEIIKYLEEIQDYLHFILEQISDLDTRRKVHITIINYLMKRFDIGTYQDEDLISNEKDENAEDNPFEEDEEDNDPDKYEAPFCTDDNDEEEELAEEEAEDEKNFASRNTLEGRKDPALMSEAEKFFEFQYLHTIFVSYINDENFLEEVQQSSIIGFTSIDLAVKIDNYNRLLRRFVEVTQLPELLDNNFNGLNKYMKGINTDKAIQKAVKKLLKEKGEKELADRIAELVNQHIENKATAKEFVLQELDAASYGDDIAQNFVSQSGFDENEYKGAMNHSSWDNDDTISHLQQFTRVFTMKIDNLKTMCSINLLIVDYIMKYWKLGKYEIQSEELDDAPF